MLNILIVVKHKVTDKKLLKNLPNYAEKLVV